MHSQLQNSSLNKSIAHRKLSLSPIQSNSKDIFINDYSTANDHYYPLTPPISTHISSQQTNYFNQRSRSSSMTPSNFIRVHFPNKHTTAVCQLDFSRSSFFLILTIIFKLASRNDETLEAALESRASRHSVTNLRSYTPVYMISR
jgi:hypothetical protein